MPSNSPDRLLARRDPVLDQPAGDRIGARPVLDAGAAVGQLAAAEPARVLELVAIEPDVVGGRIGMEAEHQRGRERPRLRRVVAHVGDLDADLLPDLAGDGVLQALARLDEAGQRRVHVLGPLALAAEDDPVAAADQHDHRRVGAREMLRAAIVVDADPDVAGLAHHGRGAAHTNMAGRGTDIVLGEGIEELGGLHILGTERHESRRIDNQLRGRSGRQGDKGTSRFYLSLEDDLLRIFGSEKISGLMAKLGMENGQPIEHNMVSKAVENAQRKVEAHNFDIRKHLLEYDDVMNKQREVIYTMRRDILTGENQKEILFDIIEDVLDENLAEICRKDIYPEEWEVDQLNELLERLFGVKIRKVDDKELVIDGQKPLPLEDCDQEKLHAAILDIVMGIYNKKEDMVDKNMMRYLERMIMLQVLDALWKDHLLAMDHLKEGIGLRGYAQKNPLTEYKKEGFDVFRNMTLRINEEILEFLFKVQIDQESEMSLEQDQEKRKVVEHRGGGEGEEKKPETVRRTEQKTGRNQPCPCGSGKKYKKCHGK